MDKEFVPKYCSECGNLLEWTWATVECGPQTRWSIKGIEVLICVHSDCCKHGDVITKRPIEIKTRRTT